LSCSKARSIAAAAAAAAEHHLSEGMTTPAVSTTRKYRGPVLLGFHANGMAGSGGRYLQQQSTATCNNEPPWHVISTKLWKAVE
jgi:hypothetical protein